MSIRSNDAIVIGGGFAGVVAARDLSEAGVRVTLIEARGRLGGRVRVDDFAGVPIEVGGTWLLPEHTALREQITRFGMATAETPRPDRFAATFGDARLRDTGVLSEASLDGLVSAMRTDAAFSLADATSLAAVLPLVDAAARAWLRAWTDFLIGAPPEETSGAWRLLLGRRSLADIDEYSTKICGGTQQLVERVSAHDGIDVRLDTEVVSLADDGGQVIVTAEGGRTWRAPAVVLAVPLNTWRRISFSRGLGGARARLRARAHPGRSVKVWAIVDGVDGFARGLDPGGVFSYLRTDRILDDGRSLMVGFSLPEALPVVDATSVENGIRRLFADARVHAVHTHDWVGDPFSAGAWVAPGPGQFADLRVAEGWHGRVFIAGGDVDAEFPGSMEGAVRSGRRAAAALLRG